MGADYDATAPSVSEQEIKLLQPYLIGEHPRADGEWDMYCPLHEDRKRSAQLNVDKGIWFCHAGCGGGSVAKLIRQKSDWVSPTAAASNGQAHSARRTASKGQPAETITAAKVQAWCDVLTANEPAIDDLVTSRGIYTRTIHEFEIGWDKDKKAYTIPVKDEKGEYKNIRRYQIRPPKGRRKIWGVEGMNEPRLYPAQVLKQKPDKIILCEGELDALIANQHGFPTVTKTGSALTWRVEWNKFFKGKTVYLCHDCDEAGQDANRKIGRALAKIAKEILIVHLPYPITEKNGKDLTDYFVEHDDDPAEFQRLLEEATPFVSTADPETVDPSDASVIDSFDSRRVGRPLRLTVTIKGKRDPGYSVPRKAKFACTRDAGQICNICPMKEKGELEQVIAGGDPVILEMMDSTKQQIRDILRRNAGIQKCTKLMVETPEFQAVEILYARPSVDHSVGAGAADYKSLKLTSVGRHDTPPNNTVRVVGALHPDPRKQMNEFLAWDVARIETSLDRFELDSETLALLKLFRPARGQTPLKKLGEIARELASHVTRIYGRPEMHAAMDLTFHSVLSFRFTGKVIRRGWLELLVVGDTRTGKSEAAERLCHHLGAGEIVSCESASFAGIIGGLQQYGASKEWAITWGAIPINDRRLVVLDEVGGLDAEQIAEMSSVRSSGEAQLTKIQQERTYARTRLIWLGNPRNGRMSDYTYGVQAIQPLIGNPEDVARFDLAMSVRAGEVEASQINRKHKTGDQLYTSEACNALLRWVWSRGVDQIVWDRGAERAVFKAANDMGSRYVEDPPLIQVANVREKIARTAVALAARLFSTDESYERVLVTADHVRDAVAFIDRIYGMSGFGYAERSRELIKDRKEAEGNSKQVKRFLRNKPGLAKFLRGASKFRRQDIEEILNCDREEANAIISTLWESRMVRKDKGDVRVEPTLHTILREV